VTRDDERGLVHVAFHGTLTASTAPLAQSTLVKCLVEQPVAVVIDVADVLSRSTIAVPLFLALRREARRAPAVPLVVVAGRASTGSSLRSALSRYLPTCVTIEEAREMAARLPSASRWHHVHLAPTPYAPSEARNAVAECCARWDLHPLIHVSRTVVSELVSNAVEHAGTEIELTVTMRGQFLCVAVRDGSPVVPRLLEPVPHEPNAPLDVRGYGLRMITNVAHSWGAEITAEGKVVWATLLATAPIAERHRRRAGERARQPAVD
jgi:anti-sigma regulatory factor (Ser/Thr protein kinase)